MHYMSPKYPNITKAPKFNSIGSLIEKWLVSFAVEILFSSWNSLSKIASLEESETRAWKILGGEIGDRSKKISACVDCGEKL